jgi:hypothetical protein
MHLCIFTAPMRRTLNVCESNSCCVRLWNKDDALAFTTAKLTGVTEVSATAII